LSSQPIPRAAGTRPKVCIVGGPDVDARRLLMRQLNESYEVCAVGTEPAHVATFASDGFRYLGYTMSRGVNPLLDLYAVWQLVRIFRAERPHVVHTFDTKPCVWGRLAARLAGVPVVVGTLPGLGSLYVGQTRKVRLLRLAYQALQTLACRLSDATTFQNEEDAREFERRLVVPRGRGLVIPGSGVQTDLFMPRDRQTMRSRRADLGLSETAVVAVMVSRILRSKGVLDFAAAGLKTRGENAAIRFVLVGREDPDSLDALTAAELQLLRASITWLGHRDDVREILALADIFVFPSFYREGVPRALLEASAAGLPLVVADVPGSRDVVEDGVNGFLVGPHDPDAIAQAVLRLAGSAELRRRFGERSRERAVSRFDLSVIARRTESLYRDLLAAKASRRSEASTWRA
jgi:glycosyltransferase involved in cell wall biosynthesis